MYEAGAGFGEGPPGGASNQSNVSCIWHGGRLLTSGEVGHPYEIDPETLGTRSVFDFGGALTTSFTAHPKVDPATGRLHAFGYGFVPPFLTYHVIEPDGTLSHSEVVDIPRSTMIHDFAITQSDVVFWDLPVVFDLEAAIAFIENPASGAFPYSWSPDAGARVGVMPLGGPASAIQWFDVDPCFAFHGVNAFRRDGEVVLDICRLSSMFTEGEVLGGELTLRRWTMDTVAGRLHDDVLAGPDPGELPTRDPRRVGREHRYGWFVETRPNDLTVDFGGLVKHDYATGRRELWQPPTHVHAGEWLFVPSVGDDGEDAGYLLTFLHDESSGVSSLAIVDATNVRAGPIATIDLPQRVPYGFHATWVPAS
jgi:carotenoid cleavage dioxygenase-like enzyme